MKLHRKSRRNGIFRSFCASKRTGVICLTLGLLSEIVSAAPTAALPAPRIFHRATPFDGMIFVFGGGTDQRFPVFDVEEQTWSNRKAPFIQGPALLSAVAGGALFVVDPFTPKLRSYNPEKDRWTDLAPPPRARANPSLVGYKGKLYLIGSYLNVPAEHSVEVYDPEKDAWSTAPPLPEIEEEHHFHLTAVLGGRLHVVGYYFGGKSHWIFDGEKWEAGADAPVACGWKGDALEAVDGALLLFKPYSSGGSEKPPEEVKEIFRYVAAEDRWESLGALPKDYPMIFGASAFVDGKIYVLGGSPNPTAVFCYDVKLGTWERSPK